MEKISFRPLTSVKKTEDEKPEKLEEALKMEWHQLPEEECYKIIDEKVQAKDYIEAKTLTSTLMKKYIKEGRSLSPQLKEYILSEWYKTTQIEEMTESEKEEETQNAQQDLVNIEEEVKTYSNVPAIVVGRNQSKRIINVAWGREQEGFFKWNFRKPLPNYNETLSLSFEQKASRGMMNVKMATPLQENANFQDDFYRVEEATLSQNEAKEFFHQDTPLPFYLFDRKDLPQMVDGTKVLIHWVYKFQPRDNEFNWSIVRVRPLIEQSTETQSKDVSERKVEEHKEEVTSCHEQTNNETASIKEEREDTPTTLRETYSLIINDIPLRNGELTCRCLTNNNELIYFRKSLTQMEINRLDKLTVTGLVRHEAFGKQFVKIERIELANDSDFPESILRKRVRRLHKSDNNIFLDDEQLATRKVQLLKIKHLMMREQSEDFSVLVEEMFLYAVHIKDYEWTIASIKAVKTNPADSNAPIVEEAEDIKEELTPEEKAKQQEALRQPWQVRVAYITKVDEERGRVEIVYGIRKKGYIALEDFPLTSPYQGDWLGMKMLDGKEPMHEIVFHDIIRLDPNKRLPNTSKLIYKVRRGILWYSSEEKSFKLHGASISNDVVLAMEQPQYKDYFLIEELLDYDEEKQDFAWRPVKIEQFEYLEPMSEMEEHIYPHKFRQEALFQKALAELGANTAPEVKQETKVKEVKAKKAEKPQVVAQEQAKTKKDTPAETLIIGEGFASFCPQSVSKHRHKRGAIRARGRKGLRAKRKQA